MPAGRPKYNFNAVSNGKEVSIYTNWTQVSDSVLGLQITLSGTELAMESVDISEFHVFDGLHAFTKSEYN